jgi:nucleoid DNA-binding protein
MNPIDRSRNLIQQVRTGAQQGLEKAQQTVSNTVDTVRNTVNQGAQRAGQVVDSFESKATKGVQALGIFGLGGKPDKQYDGMFVGAGGQTFKPGTPLKDIPGVNPVNNPNPTKTIIYVNGIMTDKAGQSSDLQAMANKTGARAIGIHNSTEGFATDLAQCVGDKLDKGRNPAVDTLADTIYTEIKAGREVNLMGYSQGGLITSRALKDVSRRLRIEDGLSKADVEKTMSRINVETFGAAAATYPDGPKYVHYVNNADAVPTLFGLGGNVDPAAFLKDAGKGAVVHRFTDGNLNLIGNHNFQNMYMKHRVPFEEARAGRF